MNDIHRQELLNRIFLVLRDLAGAADVLTDGSVDTVVRLTDSIIILTSNQAAFRVEVTQL